MNFIRSKLTFQVKIALSFVFTILVLASIFYAIIQNNRYSIKTARAVEHVQGILLHTEELRTAVDEIQSSTRSYIVSGDEKYLQLYTNSSVGINDSIQQIRELLANNSKQQNALDSLSIVINNFIRSSQQLITVRKNRGFESSGQISLTGDGESLAASARKIVVSIQKEEYKLLFISKANNIGSIRRSSTIILIFTSTCIILIAIAFLSIRKNAKRRNRAEEKVNMMNASLEKLVQEKTKDALKNELQYRFLIENMREGTYIIGYNWKYLFLNTAATEQSKFTREELLGHSLMEKHPGIESSELFHTLQHCMKDRVSEIFENEFVNPDGRKQWFELSIQPVPEGLFILSMDVTDRKKAIHELMEQKIRQQKLITEITIEAQETERNELGRELHDNINQILATVKLYLGMAKSKPGHHADLIEQCYRYVGQAIDETRKLSHTLVAPSLGDSSLHEVLQNLTEESNRVNGLKLEFINQTKNARYDKNKELMLYRIAQEQINNIRKYSKAKNANMKLENKAGQIIFSISDNGIGFDTTKARNGIGLKNIKNRVEFYLGKMNIFSSPGKGCTLEVAIPA